MPVEYYLKVKVTLVNCKCNRPIELLPEVNEGFLLSGCWVSLWQPQNAFAPNIPSVVA